MEPEIKERPAFAILGYQVRANPGQANYEEISLTLHVPVLGKA